MLNLKWFHWAIIAGSAGVGTIVGALRVETVAATVLDTVAMLIFGYIIVAIAVLSWRTCGYLLDKTYRAGVQWSENSPLLNRILYGPDWRDEIDSTES